MKPMATNQKVLTLVSILPCDEKASTWTKVISVIFPVVVLIAHLWSIVSSAQYFSKFMSDDLDSALFAVLTICGHVNMAYMFIIAHFLRHRINAIFMSLTAIYKTRRDQFEF